MQDGFLRTDAQLLRKASAVPRRKQYSAGSAAVVMMAAQDTLALAHAGDCRAILVKRSGGASSSAGGAEPVKYVELTSDHSAEARAAAEGGGPMRPDEVHRIQRAGGRFDPGGYVNVSEGAQSLPMTRALGDLPLKVAHGKCWRQSSVHEQIVTALPSVSLYERCADDLCVVLASDGLFGNVMPSAVVADLARASMEGPQAHQADIEKQTARLLSEKAITDFQGSDNVSVVVVSLQPPPSVAISSSFSAAAALGSTAGQLWPSSSSAESGDYAFSRPDSFLQERTLAWGTSEPELEPALTRPRSLASLSSVPSLDSVTTIDTCSPGRDALREVMRLPFETAYPHVEGEGDEEQDADENQQPETQQDLFVY